MVPASCSTECAAQAINGCVTGPVPASSVTTEFVLASAGLTEPPAPALPIAGVTTVALLHESIPELAVEPAALHWSPSTTNTGKDRDAAATVIEHKDAHEFTIPLTVNPSTWYDHFYCAFLDASHCPEYFVNGVHMHKQHGELLYTSGLYLAKFSGMFREFLQGCERFQGTNAWYINYHLRPWLQFECNQDGMPSVSHTIQSWLSLSARPKLCAHSLGNKHMVSVKLWAHPSGDPICKLLSLGYQDFSFFLAFHLFDTAAGHVPHMMLQSDRVEIYQVITQPGKYLSLFLQAKLISEVVLPMMILCNRCAVLVEPFSPCSVSDHGYKWLMLWSNSQNKALLSCYLTSHRHSEVVKCYMESPSLVVYQLYTDLNLPSTSLGMMRASPSGLQERQPHAILLPACTDMLQRLAVPWDQAGYSWHRLHRLGDKPLLKEEGMSASICTKGGSGELGWTWAYSCASGGPIARRAQPSISDDAFVYLGQRGDRRRLIPVRIRTGDGGELLYHLALDLLLLFLLSSFWHNCACNPRLVP